MPVYTVHEPPLKAGEASADPERIVFVRDGFAFWAFLLMPLWLIAKRLWLALLGYGLLIAVVTVILQFVGASPSIRFWSTFLIAVLCGLEAASLQRWTLARRKWRQAGTVVADNIEEAERRFFLQWTDRRQPPVVEPAVSGFSGPVINPPRAEKLPLGLFPQPGAGR
jgi:hypothetical protein